MKEQFRPQPENQKLNAPEPAAGPLGIPPPPDTEQAAQGSKSPEHQPLPGVWDILEREVRLYALDVKGRPRWGSEEYNREFDELNRLQEEQEEKGAPRNKLIRDLYWTTLRANLSPARSPGFLRRPSLEEFQQFRSKVEPMSEEELREEIRRQEEGHNRKWEVIHKRDRPQLPGMAMP